MPSKIHNTDGAAVFSAEERAQILSEASASDVVMAEVARRHGISPAELYRWRYAARDASQQNDDRQFVPVEIIDELITSPKLQRISLDFGSDISLTLEGSVSRDLLSRILDAIEIQ